jgi:hypothetical protein
VRRATQAGGPFAYCGLIPQASFNSLLVSE